MNNHFLLDFQRVHTICLEEACKTMGLKSCPDCLKTFHNKSNLNRHIEKAHSNDSEEEVKSDSSDSDESSIDPGDALEPWVVKVWTELKLKAERTNQSFIEVYKDAIIFVNSLARDDTHQSVMETFKKARNDDDMDFEEALDFSLDKRKFLIAREFDNAENDQYDGSAENDDEMQENLL